MIYKNKPNNWKDLQNKVAEVFKMLNYETETPHLLSLVRGNKEVDVYAVNKSSIPEITILVECKLWKKKVSQTEVHAFRTVVADSGANIGYLISESGYQKGCYKAVEKTNIKLLNWIEFNQLYIYDYFVNLMKTIRNEFVLFTDYTEPINSRVFKMVDLLSEEKKLSYDKLKDKYIYLLAVIIDYSYTFEHWPNRNIYSTFPIIISSKDNENCSIYYEVNSIEEFVDAIRIEHAKAMVEFSEVFS